MKSLKRYCSALLIIFVGGVVLVRDARSETIIHNFAATADGSNPVAGVIADASGNLYGTTMSDDTNNAGIVFELSPPAQKNGPWTEAVLYVFKGGQDGAKPGVGLIMDKKGNLFGTTTLGDQFGAGTVFELVLQNGQWTESILYSFKGAPDGQTPWGLTFDPKGGLVGVTQAGGNGCGVVFEVIRQPKGNWIERVAYRFHAKGGDACSPLMRGGSLLVDKSRNFYGTTALGGQSSNGTVFKVSPPTQKGGQWTETLLYSFAGGTDGAPGYGSLTFDKAGNLYGATPGGGSGSVGTVFELSPGQNGWTKTLLFSFSGGSGGSAPDGGLVFDGAGNLYGTTSAGGQYGKGIGFQLVQHSGVWSETVLHSFGHGKYDGTTPEAPLLLHHGVLYGTTFSGGQGQCGSLGCGTVFTLHP